MRAAAAYLVVTNIDQVYVSAIPGGTLRIKPTTEASVHG